MRPVVKINLCLGSKKLLIRTNLNDRSKMKYLIIIGRNVLKKGFIVDAEKANLFPPDCIEDSP